MKIGIGLPTTIAGVQGEEVIDWAQRAEAAGFSTLGTIDRVVYANYEPLVALAAAAVEAPSSIRACRPSQRQMPKMLRIVRTMFVHTSAGCPVIRPVASHASEPIRNTQKP